MEDNAERLRSLLRDAITMLEDLRAGYFADDLHTSLDDFLTDAKLAADWNDGPDTDPYQLQDTAGFREQMDRIRWNGIA